MAITATQNDGVSLTADNVSYELVETDVDIITSGRRRIPAHSGVLVSFLLLHVLSVSYVLHLISSFYYFWELALILLLILNFQCRLLHRRYLRTSSRSRRKVTADHRKESLRFSVFHATPFQFLSDSSTLPGSSQIFNITND